MFRAKLSKTAFTFLCSLSFFLGIWAQSDEPQENSRAIEFPHIPGYVTLKCDLHIHTVFSDGHVWPGIRVQEALRDGLDVISITDHIEYQPHQKEIPHPDRNTSYELALKAAQGTGLLVIPGTEITRSMPPGHFNAVFVQDVNKMNQQDVMEVFREAKRQGAFVFWNHPHWTAQRPDGVATLTEMHLELLEEGLFAGIEVYNDDTYSGEALEIANKYGLTLLGNSDVHGLVDWTYQVPEGGHRPLTLVFAREKSAEAMQRAMEQRQTVVWFKNTLVGHPEFLIPLLEASLEVTRTGKGAVPEVQIRNHSDADLILENISDYSLHNFAPVFVLKAHTKTSLMVKTLEPLESFELRFRVLNAYTAANQHPQIKLPAEQGAE
ncbi:MAG: Sb-PDE family phosphodiesterase [Bacteroidales bacterium]|nr:Sb-PDE family phosphodiesterase [Bacteroidales bacterium]